MMRIGMMLLLVIIFFILFSGSSGVSVMVRLGVDVTVNYQCLYSVSQVWLL